MILKTIDCAFIKKVRFAFMNKNFIRKLGISVVGLLLIVIITFAVSGLWILNTNYVDTGYLEDKTNQYQYLAEDLSNQIYNTESVLQKIENNPSFSDILTSVHTSQEDVLQLYNAIDFEWLIVNDDEAFVYDNMVIFTTNPSVTIDSTIHQITESIQFENWYVRISQSRRKYIMFVENGAAQVLYKLNFEGDESGFIHYAKVDIDLSFMHHTKLKDYKILLSNVYYNNVAEVSGQRNLSKPLTEYFGISDSLYIEDEMILAYVVVPGSTASRWTLIIVTPRANFFNDFVIYALAITSIFLAIGYVIFYRINLLRKMRKSVDQLSIVDINSILLKSQPNKVEDLIRNMYGRILSLVQDNQKLDLINQEKEIQKNEAEMNALLSQIDPHYIFNLLNSIHKRALKNNEIESAKMILLMSKQLRRSLEWKHPMVTIKDELDHIKSYIALQQYFIGYDYHVLYDIDSGLNFETVPKLIFQSLVENALKHGVPTDRFIIKLDSKEGFLRFSVKNEVLGDPKESLLNINKAISTTEGMGNTTGVGLQNVVRRLKFYYGEDFQIVAKNVKQTITIQVKLSRNLKEQKNDTTVGRR
jgi:two-component system, sensor histidine kinase YesM